MHLDLTIRLGDLVAGGMAVAAALGAYVKLRERLIVIETKLMPLWAEFERRRHAR